MEYVQSLYGEEGYPMISGKRVLVIDDDPLVLKSLGSILKMQGYEYSLAENGERALKFASESEFDLVLADIRMPLINGVEVVKRIRDGRKKLNKNDLPIIFITGYAEDGMHLRADFLGEVVQKPFDLDQLMITMREYL